MRLPSLLSYEKIYGRQVEIRKNVGIKMDWKRNILFVLLALLLVACGDTVPTDRDSETENKENIEKQPTEETTKPKPTETEDETVNLPDASLQKKDEGPAVLELQQALEKIGYTIPQDSVYSDATTWAITDFQLQTENLYGTGVYDESTRVALEKVITSGETVEAGRGLEPLTEPAFTASGSEVLGNPYDQLAIVNKNNALPQDYVPNDLIVPNVSFPFEEDLPKKQLRAPAANALEDLFEEALKEGYYLYAQSGYRSYERQETLFSSYSEEHGEEAANVFSAIPGESEHQTGLAMDISSESIGFQLTTEFGETPEGKWVSEHAHEFGFIIRYPEGKEEITKYQYEPWHLRYVGKRAADEMKKNELTLEEYFEQE